MSKIGIIGGSGVYNIEGISILEEVEVNTPFGKTSDKVVRAQLEGTELCFIPRHGRGHAILPHEVNYRANIFALKKMGVEYLISISAVGSLVEECPPESFVLPDQFIDWTKGKRERSFFGNGIVAHVSVAQPICLKLQEILWEACKEADVSVSKDGSYVCIEGPQFSSKAESNIYRSFGAKVIGMTNVPEAYLAKEAGMAYSTIAMVTDYDCWKEEHCTIEEILKVMAANATSVQKMIKIAIPRLANNLYEFEKENRIGIMTPMESMTEEQKEWVDILLK